MFRLPVTLLCWRNCRASAQAEPVCMRRLRNGPKLLYWHSSRRRPVYTPHTLAKVLTLFRPFRSLSVY
jgi:hypothetical protein